MLAGVGIDTVGSSFVGVWVYMCCFERSCPGRRGVQCSGLVVLGGAPQLAVCKAAIATTRLQRWIENSRHWKLNAFSKLQLVHSRNYARLRKVYSSSKSTLKRTLSLRHAMLCPLQLHYTLVPSTSSSKSFGTFENSPAEYFL